VPVVTKDGGAKVKACAEVLLGFECQNGNEFIWEYPRKRLVSLWIWIQKVPLQFQIGNRDFDEKPGGCID
jgi:hypothetical protein